MSPEIQKRCLDIMAITPLNPDGFEVLATKTCVSMLLFHTINLRAHVVEWEDIVKLVDSWLNSLGVEEARKRRSWQKETKVLAGVPARGHADEPATVQRPEIP